MNQAEFRELPVAQLFECTHNPRTRFDPEAMAELVASVRDHGVLTPLLVRPQPARKGAAGGFEIGAGHRRFRAALEAGLETVPALVREMDDEAFIELLNLENLQRADLNAIEEAEGYRQLLALPGRDVHAVAARVSRSVKYVYDRLKLLDLIEPARELLLADRITVGHAILVARLAPDDQRIVLEDGLFEPELPLARFFESPEDYQHHAKKPVSVRELAGWIDQHVRFDRASVDPFVHPRTHETLFAAQQAEEAEKVVPITRLHALPPSARADERTLCRRSWRRADGTVDPDDALTFGGRGTKASKTCEHAVLGVIVVGPQRGEAFRICAAKKLCSVHWPQQRAESKSGREKRVAQEVRRENAWAREEEKRRLAREEWAAVLPKVTEAFEQAIASADASGQGPLAHALVLLTRMPKSNKWKSADDVLRALVLHDLRDELRDTWDAGKGLEPFAKVLGVDLKALRKEGVQTSAQAGGTAKKKRKKASRRKVASA